MWMTRQRWRSIKMVSTHEIYAVISTLVLDKSAHNLELLCFVSPRRDDFSKNRHFRVVNVMLSYGNRTINARQSKAVKRILKMQKAHEKRYVVRQFTRYPRLLTLLHLAHILYTLVILILKPVLLGMCFWCITFEIAHFSIAASW